MDDMDKVSCVLCLQCEETEVTGALSTKDEVTAHQNCLFDDLFGFSVEDVLDEVKRGSKLNCNKCKKKGATAGCEVKRCKKSYHYPCAVQDGANNVEDADQGKYGLYCFYHYQLKQRHNVSVNGGPSSVATSLTSKSASEAESSKVYCLACKKKEGNISLDNLCSSIVMLYCHKHAPASSHQRNANGDSTTARRLSVCSSDSNSSSSGPSSYKRKLNLRNKQDESASKRRAWNMIVTDDSSNSDESDSESEKAIFGPIDTDFDDSANSVPETQLIRNDSESPTGSTSGNQVVDGSVHGNYDRDEIIMHSDAESDSLLLPVSRSPSATTAVVSTRTAPTLSPCLVLFKMEVTAAQRLDQGSSPDQSPAVPQQSSAGPPPSPYRSKPLSLTRSPPCTSSAISPAPPIGISLAPPSDRKPSFHSTSFWKRCNAAGCTQALFTGFINEMNAISSRIQSDLASPEDYDHALTVMTASGKLTELVAKQQEELQRKQTELLKATAAMKEVVSALKTCVHQQIL